MNINMLRDSDNDPGFYIAVTCPDTTWKGATVYRSTDDGVNYSTLALMFARATMGVAVNVLGGFGGGNVPDELNSLTVRLDYGSLASITYAQLIEGGNMAIIGDEIVCFRSAVLNVDGTYTLSGFLRGRRGSEYAISAHVAGERFVLVSGALKRITQTTGDIGKTRLYKAVTSGAQGSSATAQSFTNTAAGLKPYAPVHLGGGRDQDDNLVLNWVRRGRMSGEWRDGADVPLSEENERFEVEIWDSGFSSLKRTITGVSGQTANYSAADQATDFGSPPVKVGVKVFQMSAIVGRGYPATATV